VNPPQLFPLPNPADFAVAVGASFPGLCTIQAPLDGSGDQDAYGAPHGPSERTYATLTGHEDLACAVAPEGGTTASASKERRTAEYTQEWNLFEIILNGYYPLIKQTHQAVVDGKTYEIQGVNSDVYKILTHLHCRTLDL
jgi:hypothetical protein